MACSGNEFRLGDCEIKMSPVRFYSLGITCKNGFFFFYIHSSLTSLCSIYPTDIPEQGEVKLFYNSYLVDSSEGVLEIWLDDQWGTVYDNNWTIADADTVCHQLGRNGNVLAHTQKPSLLCKN